MIRFACPRCKSVLEAPDRKAGSKVACPKCQQRLQIPVPPPRNKTILVSFLGYGPNSSALQPKPTDSKVNTDCRSSTPPVLSSRDLASAATPTPAPSPPVASRASAWKRLRVHWPGRRFWLGLVALLPALFIVWLTLHFVSTGGYVQPAGQVTEKQSKTRPADQAPEKRSDAHLPEEELVRRYIVNNEREPKNVQFVEWGPHMTWQEIRELFDEAGIVPQPQGHLLAGGPATDAARAFFAAFASDVFSGMRGIAIVRVACRFLGRKSLPVPLGAPDPPQFLFLVEGKKVVPLVSLGYAIGIGDAAPDWKKHWRINLARTFPAINVER